MRLIFLALFSFHVFAQDLELRKPLFKTNCTSCHYLGPEEKKLIGPGLNDHIFEEYLDVLTNSLYKVRRKI